MHLCRVQDHALLPNETMYTRTFFPIPQDQDYYIVGFLADIVNKVHVHHFVAYFCTVGVDSLYSPPQAPGFPEQPKNESDVGAESTCMNLAVHTTHPVARILNILQNYI